MLRLLWSRSDFWTWLFLDFLSPVYFFTALFLYYRYLKKTSRGRVDAIRVAFWSLLAIVGLLHLAFGGPRLVLSGHTAFINSVAFSPDGQFLVSAADDETVTIWDPVTGENLETLTYVDPVPVNSLDFSPDGKIVALGTWNKITLLNVTDGKALATLGKHRERGGTDIDAVLFLSNAKKLVAADMNSLRVWDVESKTIQAALLDESKDFFQAEAIAASRDGKILASGNHRGKVTLWEVLGKKRIVTFAAHGDEKVSALAFSPDGRLLASGGHDARTVLWHLKGNQPEEIFILKADTGDINTLAFSPDGKLLATGAYHIRIWNVATGKLMLTTKGRRVRIRKIAFSPDGARLAAGGEDGIIEVWSVKSRKNQLTLKVDDGFPVLALGFSPDGKILASGTRGGLVTFWDPVSGKKKSVFQTDGKKSSPNIGTVGHKVEALAFSPDGKTLAAGTWKIVNLWDTETWQLRRNFWLGGDFSIKSLIFFPTGQLFAANEKASAVWTIATGERVSGVDKRLGPLATLSHDGKILATGSGYGLNLWNTGRWSLMFHLQMLGRKKVTSMAFSPNGKILAVGNAANELALWISSRWQRVPNVLNKVGCGGAVVSLAFSPNSRWLAARTVHSRARWVLFFLPLPESPGCITLFRIKDNYFSFMPWRAEIGGSGLSFSSDSKTLAAASGMNTIKLWQVE